MKAKLSRFSHASVGHQRWTPSTTILGGSLEQRRPQPLRLKAQKFDLLESSGGVDTAAVLRGCLGDSVRAEHGIFLQGASGHSSFAGVARSDRAEYAALVALQVRSNKVELRRSCTSGGTVFSVPKAGSDKLREIWHGKASSQQALSPPAPTHLVALEASDNRPLYLNKRDGRCLFDQLLAPQHVRAWFGRPTVRAPDLAQHRGFSYAEMQAANADNSMPLPHDLLVVEQYHCSGHHAAGLRR